jgi:CRISPR-associated protein Cmr5
MDKSRINKLLPAAYDVLKEVGIANEAGEINKTWRGQISSFGAAVTMGSLLSAISFFSSKGGSDVDRKLLMDAILKLLPQGNVAETKSLFKYVRSNSDREQAVKHEVLEAAVALKIAMNLYELKS